MKYETLKKLNELLKHFNSTFEIEARITRENNEEFADGLKIGGLKNDGSEFVNSLHDTFNSIVQSVSQDHELIYDQEKGLVIAKKVVKTDYIIEDFK